MYVRCIIELFIHLFVDFFGGVRVGIIDGHRDSDVYSAPLVEIQYSILIPVRKGATAKIFVIFPRYSYPLIDI